MAISALVVHRLAKESQAVSLFSQKILFSKTDQKIDVSNKKSQLNLTWL